MNQTLVPLSCSCYFIDPSKFQILLWKRTKVNTSATYLLKIADQRFIGLSRTDKKGESYWKFKDLAEDQPSLAVKELTAVEKFQTRQDKTQLKESYGKSNNSIENNNNSS